MSNIDQRIDWAVEWLHRSQAGVRNGGAGWGWLSDVLPNPQNTAEVVVALAAAGRPVPRAAEVSTLVRRDVVDTDSGEWVFRSPIDLSWRLRALHCLGVPPADPVVVHCLRELYASRDADTRGWRLSEAVGPISLTATTAALHALADLAGTDETAAEALLQGTSLVVSMMLRDDPRAQPIYACAHVARLLARPEIAAVGGKRVDKVRELTVQRMLQALREGKAGAEEESFREGLMASTWRHLGLHLAVGAVVTADDRAVFDPGVRRGLVELLELQETQERSAVRGGFRTSAGGFITSFATVQGLEAMLAVRRVVNERVNPAVIYDLICRERGAHPQDAQQVVGHRGRAVLMNSYAGGLTLAAAAPAGLTIVLLAVFFAGDLGVVASRALVVWGTFVIALGTYTGIATRLPSVAKGRTAAAVFAAYTAVVLPIVTYLLS
ncbi:hypothetical protein [Nocardia carnea]|uniref:hypothetical protein n=1 Tax=Nocardia carnea TaxID=37328 RepID=UPI002458AE74|nr:hypothetical protein [Nocardia carnea]